MTDSKHIKRTELELIGVVELTADGSIRNIKTGTVYSEFTRGKANYVSVQVKGKAWCKHRIVWTLTHGEIPEGLVVDHIDGDTSNNSIDNLRLATKRQNQHNRRVSSTEVKPNGLPKGVSMWRGWYRVQIRANDKRYSKNFKTLDEAVEWAKEKRRELHGEFYRD